MKFDWRGYTERFRENLNVVHIRYGFYHLAYT